MGTRLCPWVRAAHRWGLWCPRLQVRRRRRRCCCVWLPLPGIIEDLIVEHWFPAYAPLALRRTGLIPSVRRGWILDTWYFDRKIFYFSRSRWSATFCVFPVPRLLLKGKRDATLFSIAPRPGQLYSGSRNLRQGLKISPYSRVDSHIVPRHSKGGSGKRP